MRVCVCMCVYNDVAFSFELFFADASASKVAFLPRALIVCVTMVHVKRAGSRLLRKFLIIFIRRRMSSFKCVYNRFI